MRSVPAAWARLSAGALKALGPGFCRSYPAKGKPAEALPREPVAGQRHCFMIIMYLKLRKPYSIGITRKHAFLGATMGIETAGNQPDGGYES